MFTSLTPDFTFWISSAVNQWNMARIHTTNMPAPKLSFAKNLELRAGSISGYEDD
jgi:hypothetical protein